MIVVSLVLSFTWSSYVVAAEWVYVGSADTSRMFYDLSSVKILKNHNIRVWSKVKEVEGYSMGLFEFDCKEKKSKLLSYAAYGKDSKIVQSQNYKDATATWDHVIPGSFAEGLMNSVCSDSKRKQKETTKPAKGDWVYFFESDKDKKYYYDRSSVKYFAGKRVIFKYKCVDTNGEYGIVKWEMDCADNKMKMLTLTSFDNENDVRTPETTISDNDWRYIKPETLGDKIASILCQ